MDRGLGQSCEHHFIGFLGTPPNSLKKTPEDTFYFISPQKNKYSNILVQKEHIYIVDIEANFQTYNRAYKIKQEKGYIFELFLHGSVEIKQLRGTKSIKKI